ncbi:cell wall integrity and stress response component 4-like, partial [Elysia marginata]
YARPILARCYDVESGSRYIDAHVELTANHLGYMQFRLCANNDFTKPVTQDCLDENLLQISSRSGKRIGKTLKLNSRHVLDIYVKLIIPDNLTCSQCVLQWSYVTANSWGCRMIDTRRRCAMGLGGQETFWACSDIAIVPDCRKLRDDKSSDPPTQHTGGQKGNNNSASLGNPRPPSNQLTCIALGHWYGQPHMGRWCELNCGSGFCPKIVVVVVVVLVEVVIVAVEIVALVLALEAVVVAVEVVIVVVVSVEVVVVVVVAVEVVIVVVVSVEVVVVVVVAVEVVVVVVVVVLVAVEVVVL